MLDTLAPVQPSHVQKPEEKADNQQEPDQVQVKEQDQVQDKLQQQDQPQQQQQQQQPANGELPANQRVAFAGYFLVKSATQNRHIRYAMDVSCPELGLKSRFTQRFSAYFYLRKRLIKTLKCCCSGNSTFWIAEWGQEDMPRKCKCCALVRSQVKKLDFPKRRLFTNVADIEHRSEVLERFLNSILEILVEWEGDCVRGRRLFASVLSRFLGVNIAREISQLIHAKTDRRVIEDLRQTMPDIALPALSMSEFPPLPSMSEFPADAKDEEEEQQQLKQTLSECETEPLPQSEASAATQKDETKASDEDNQKNQQEEPQESE